jgi:WD40 repeat protein
MRRFLRLSLTQLLLLVALVSLVISVVTVVRSRFGVMYNEPSLAVSPDGKTLASGHSVRPLFRRQHPVLVQSQAEPHASVTTCEAHRWAVTDVAYAPNGKSLFSVGDRSIRQWDARTGAPLSVLDTGMHAVNCLALSADGRLAATGGALEVKVWDLATYSELTTLTGHTSIIRNVAFSPDGCYLVSSGMDGTLRIWNTQTWRSSRNLAASGPSDIVFAADGRLVISGYGGTTGQNGSVNVSIIEIPSGRVRDVFCVEPSWAAVSAVAASRDGKLLAAAHGGDNAFAHSAVTIWDLQTKETLTSLNIAQHGKQWIDELEFSSDGDTLFCASQDNVVTAQQWRTGRCSVVFSSGRIFPWGLVGGGGLIWIAAWYFFGQRKKPKCPA